MDDPTQAESARSLFTSESVWIAKTVLLQTEWVLRTVYGFDPKIVVHGFRKLPGLPNVQVEDSHGVIIAFDLAAHALDFADTLDISSGPQGAAFCSFDVRLVRRATRAGAPGVSLRAVVSSVECQSPRRAAAKRRYQSTCATPGCAVRLRAVVARLRDEHVYRYVVGFGGNMIDHLRFKCSGDFCR